MKIDVEKEFHQYFNEIKPNKMVEFINAFREGRLFAFDLEDGSDFLLEEDRKDCLLEMMNSGNFLFGTEKPNQNELKEEDILEGGSEEPSLFQLVSYANIAHAASVISYNLFDKALVKAKEDGYGVMYAHELIAQYSIEFHEEHREVKEWEEYCDKKGFSDWEEYICDWVEKKF